jgi:hypothetical protein
MIHSILAIIQFELSRILTWQRMSVAVVMAVFPPVMVTILMGSGVLFLPEFAVCVLCGMICLLSLLLWATPNVYAELEGKSWTFVTCRPHGRLAILFGKYLIAVLWSFSVSWAGMSFCLLVIDPQTLVSKLPVLDLWLFLTAILFLASSVYAAIFSFFGVIVQRRAMVVAVGYFLIIEVVAAAIPAVIGKVAMSYHLLCLLIQWVSWIFPDEHGQSGLEEFRMLWGLWPSWLHLLAIATMTMMMLTLSAWVIRSREYLTLEDAQV